MYLLQIVNITDAMIDQRDNTMQCTELNLQYDLQLRKTCELIGVEPQETKGITLHKKHFTHRCDERSISLKIFFFLS